MRFTAPADAVEMRLEIFSPAGNKLFDSEFRRGNVLDWRTQDSAGLSTEPHLWVVTVKTLAGQLRQRHGTVSWQSGRAAAQRVAREQLTGPQTQAWELSRAAQSLPPLTEDADAASFNVLSEQTTPAATVTAHDSQTGQVTSTAGALTFRTGDVFAAKDVERMRVTEDGKVGIGTNNPQTTLDVAGTIRAERILIAKPKLGSFSQMAGADTAPAEAGVSTALATGSGTQDQIAKWIDNAGTLGDSAITETGGNVGIGTTSPGALLDVTNNTNHLKYSPTTAKLTLTGPASNLTANPGLRLEFNSDPDAGLSYLAYAHDNISQAYDSYWNGAAWVSSHVGANFAIYKTASQLSIGFNAGTPKGSTFPAFDTSTGVIFSNTGSMGVGGAPASAKLYVNGNVGIGTTAPVAKLDVVGNVNFTGFRTELTSNTPNVIGGDSTNVVEAGAFGATISGGGAPFGRNRVFDYAGTVGGGNSNTAGNYATVAGGSQNTASGQYSTVPGGVLNTAQGNYSFAAGSNAQALHAGSFVWSDTSAHFLFDVFKSTANNQFLINATGGVGIGTNAPGYRLDVVGRSRIRQNAGQTGGTNSAGFWFFQNTPAADRAFVGMETDNSVGFFGGNGGGWGLIMNTQTGDVGIGTSGPTQKLHVEGNGLFSGNLTVNGNVGIGTSAPDAKLSVNGHASKPGGGSWNVFSDERLKNIKGRFATGLNAVMKLKPLRYEYKNDNALNLKSEGEYIGFSAQAVQKVIPEAVTKNSQGYLLVNNDPIMWTMLNAIKEQQAQIEQQQQQIEALKKLVCSKNANAEVCKEKINSTRQ